MSLELLVALLTAWLRDDCCTLHARPDTAEFVYQLQCQPRCALGHEFVLDVTMTRPEKREYDSRVVDPESPWVEYREA